MIDEQYLSNLTINSIPYGQIILGYGFNLPNFQIPPTTKIKVENSGKIPDQRPVIFAMNHTDRFNYFPFLHQLWRINHSRYTVTWVKAKYYENPILARIFDFTNNIPLPSLGYLIVKDFIRSSGRKTNEHEYHLIRDYVESKLDREKLLLKTDEAVKTLLTVERGGFNPDHETYRDYIHRRHKSISSLVEQRSLEAIHQHGYNLLVFPEGTRSVRLQRGRTGLVEFALKHDLTIVPVGSNGSDQVYYRDLPLAGGGTIKYRIGDPMRPDDEFSDISIDGDYVPFTRDTISYHERFREATDRVMQNINNLLDTRHQIESDEEDRTSPERHV